MRVLLVVGDALVRLGFLRAAERCFSLVAQRAPDAATRATALAGLARAAGASAQKPLFLERRQAALRELLLAPRITRAALHLDLAEAALAAGDVDFSREHVREALALTGSDRRHGLTVRAEAVLSQLESAAATELPQRPAPEVLEQTRRIAAELEVVADSVVAAE
jgi:hypothetical protein